ncbi:MAG: RecQ family ATP-dependent DNA helicase [Treponema sp.]|jgi:ATP-dependent DNA helicase RecQ|nr:RecQ family ATP-dependent DNA helicase [Treponema sp.]
MNINYDEKSEARACAAPDPLSQAVHDLFGLNYLFPYQRLVIANILEAAGVLAASDGGGAEDGGIEDGGGAAEDRADLGRQIVILPTGAGKSLCFQLPAMLLPGPTLVIYPILSLMADQERRLSERGLEPVLLRGQQSREEREAVWGKLRSGASRFIIANPEVLLTKEVLRELGAMRPAHLVIDEAHCVSEWGESFRPSYLRISEILEALSEGERAPLVTAFTATASAPVLERIERYVFGGRGARRIIGNPDRSNITYTARGALVKNLAVRDLLAAADLPGIVFCSSRKGTERIAAYLRRELPALRGLPETEVRFYHAGLSREEKTAVEEWFFKSRQGILAATCAYGMGVDKSDIRTVIHRDCPPSVEAYLQESGRAGRDGAQSLAILLWGPEDESRLALAKEERDRERLAQLLAFGRNVSECRRAALRRLLNYEGQAGETPAGGAPEYPCCDVCEGASEAAPREEAALLRFFAANKRAFTPIEAASELGRVQSLRWQSEDAREAIFRLMQAGKIKLCKNWLWKGRLVPARGKSLVRK